MGTSAAAHDSDEEEHRVLRQVLNRVSSPTHCNLVCHAWQAYLSNSSKDTYSPPCLLLLTKESIMLHNMDVHLDWLQVTLSLPHPHSLITKAWSCGPRLLILLGSTLSPFRPGSLCLWNPLSLSLTKLPPFATIWHLISLGFGDGLIVAAGFDCNIQCVVEVYHVIDASATWQVIGWLPLTFNVQEHDEILYCDGFFYVLCMESSMLVINPSQLTLMLRDIPCPSAPKLIGTHNSIFMVDKDFLQGSFVLWKFDKPHDHWQAIPMEYPFQGSHVTIIDIKGVGMSICFILSTLSVMMYDLSDSAWHSLPDCPNLPTSKALIWEPRVVF